MYKLNTDSKIVQKILQFDLEVGKLIADIEATKGVKKLEKVIA